MDGRRQRVWGAVVGVVALLAGGGVARADTSASTTLDGCTYTIFSQVESGFGPPIYDVILSRETGDGCALAPDSTILGTSYAVPEVSIASDKRSLAVSFTRKQTPSGEAHTSLTIESIDPSTLSVLRATTLAAMSPDPFHPQLGNVYSGELSIVGNNLLVTGTKDGIIPGAHGDGDQYRALYPNFLSDHGAAPPPVIFTF